MNVYDMKADGSGTQWVWLYTRHNLALPSQSAQESAFFDAHPRIEVERSEYTPRGSKAKLPDCSNLSHDVHPVFSQRAKDLLADRLLGLGRWVELGFDEAPYWLFHVTNVVDALDEPNSEVVYFTDEPKKVLRIAQYIFRPEKVQGQFLFTLPQRPGSNRLVTDEFVDLVREHRLTGFSFEFLWSSETGPRPLGLKDWEKPRFTGLEADPPATALSKAARPAALGAGRGERF
jgi:hypothetical protein